MILVSCPIISYGGSTGLAPIHVSTIKLLIRVHRVALVIGLIFFTFFFLLVIIGRMKTTKDPTNATTPPNFDGMERRMA